MIVTCCGRVNWSPAKATTLGLMPPLPMAMRMRPRVQVMTWGRARGPMAPVARVTAPTA